MSSKANRTPFEIISAIAQNAGLNEDFTYTYAQILGGVFNTENHSSGLLEDEGLIIEALNEISENMSDDFSFDFDGNEYRIIHNMAIWDIYVETIKNIVEDCYSDVIKLDKIPSFIAVTIDWEVTAHNAYADGYGHTFASYDGEETTSDNGDYWIFRTN